MILCVETMIRHFHLVSMLLQWYHLVLGVQLVIMVCLLYVDGAVDGTISDSVVQ